MKCSTNLSEAEVFTPVGAFVTYRHKTESTYRSDIRHVLVGYDIKDGKLQTAQPYPLKLSDLLAALNDGSDKLTWLPDRVLATGRDSIAWWCPASKRKVEYGDKDGSLFIEKLWPSLVFKVEGGRLFVWKVDDKGRPSPESMVYNAPFPQITSGHVHLCGVSAKPKFNDIDGWEKVFFESKWRCAKVDWTRASRQSRKPVKKIKGRIMNISRIHLVGVGGTGSQVLSGLARINYALRCRGGEGFHVNTYDPDLVSEANVGRQLFTEMDVGYSKANILTHRVNMHFGTSWHGYATAYSHKAFGGYESPDIVIGCVDSKASRCSIRDALKERACGWVIDCGNSKDYGQVFLGHAILKQFPNPYVEYPELTEGEETDTTPSCSLAEALNKQSLFVNQMTATLALQLVADMTLEGKISHRGAFFNLKEFQSQPIPLL